MAMHKRTNGTKLTAAIAAAAAVAGVTLLGTSYAGAAPAPAMGTVYGADAATAVSGSYIVMLDQKADKAKLAKEYGGKLKRTYSSALNGFSANGLSQTEAKRLAADPAVSKVVQNKKFHIDATQDNPPSWGLDRIDQTETAGDHAYTYPDSAGEGVTAYVIDTGVRVTHKEFEGRATSGFDAVDNDDSADDGNGHGTHVAGTIAGATFGVAKKAKIVAVRVLDDSGSGTTEQVVAGIDWVTAHHEGPSVANMSLGGGADPALDAAVQKAIASGVTFAVAAGNESADASEGSRPASRRPSRSPRPRWTTSSRRSPTTVRSWTSTPRARTSPRPGTTATTRRTPSPVRPWRLRTSSVPPPSTSPGIRTPPRRRSPRHSPTAPRPTRSPTRPRARRTSC